MLKQLDPANVLTKFADITAAGEQVIETNIPKTASQPSGTLPSNQNYDLIQFAAGSPLLRHPLPHLP